MPEPTLNVGRGADKRAVPVSQVDDENLNWYATLCQNSELRAIAQTEVQRRGKGGARPAAQQPVPRTATPPPPKAQIPADLIGSLRDPAAITDRLQKLSESFNLVSPSTACGCIPHGTEVSFSFVGFRTDDKYGDVYPQRDKEKQGYVSHTASALQRLASMAGMKWGESKQVWLPGDPRDPRFIRWSVTGAVPSFDGELIPLTRTRLVDLRDGSDQALAMKENQLPKARQNAVALAETKATNRVIRQLLGIRSAYLTEDMAKPFCVVRLVFTGVTDVKELMAPMAMLKAQQMLSGMQMLGFAPPALPALQAPQHAAAPQLTGRHETFDANGVSVQDPSGARSFSDPDDDDPDEPDDAPPDFGSSEPKKY